MEVKQYINERLDDQIEWYDKKSQISQKRFKRLKIVEIFSAALIPFLVAYADTSSSVQFLVGSLGIAIAVIAGLLSLYKFQENWIEYRNTAETLKHQKYLFEASCAPYDQEDSFKKLVQICEGIISKENSNWSQYVKINEDKKEETK